jgi:uncharacterized membrane protein YeaQ/YmgE (transglycosylase-associated protein family)
VLAIIAVIVNGFVTGALARWAVPGPDPMPVWLTLLIGLLGSALGGGIAAAVAGTSTRGAIFAILISSIAVSALLVIAYRRFVQKRPFTGPEALRPPTRGVGIGAQRAGPGFGPPRQEERNERLETLKKLDELHDQGQLTDEEYLEQRSKVLHDG